MKLTVICVFQNQKDHIEPTLTALYEAEGFPFEVVIIDDASTDQSRDVIHSLYDYYKHENTFIFEHDEPHGRGLCLNEATQVATGDVIWLVDRIDKVITDELEQQVDRLIASKASCMLMSESYLPDDIETWIEQINNGRLLTNENYLWRWNQIPIKNRFFNPYQNDFHATEAAIRIADRDKIILGNSCFESRSAMGRMAGISANRAEILISLFRERKVSIEQADLLMSQLKLKEKKLMVDTSNRDLSELLDEARAYLHEGYNIDALEISNKLLEKYPDNLEVLTLKVQVLNRLNRYVEASELKHQIQHRYGYNLNIPKIGERRLSSAAAPVDEDGNIPSRQPVTPVPISDDSSSARLNQLLTKPPDGVTPPAAPPVLKPDLVTSPPIVEKQEPNIELDIPDAELDSDYDFPEPIPISTKQDADQDDDLDSDDVNAQSDPADTDEDESIALPTLEDLVESKHDADDSDLADEEDDEEEMDFEVKSNSEDDYYAGDDFEQDDVDETDEAPEDLQSITQKVATERVLNIPQKSRPLVSVVIVTASDRLGVLQQCLFSLAEHSNPEQVEIIVVDNASLDSTYEYLQQLEENEHFRFRSITNRENKGFAFAANQGMDIASGTYICLVHNDILFHDDAIGTMTDIMENHPELTMIGPIISESNNPAQLPGATNGGDVVEVDTLDSACMFMRAKSRLRFDVAYGLAWFEDVDLCNQAKDDGYHIAIAPDVYVQHFSGTTTDDFGIEKDSKVYWTNKAYFDRKWGLIPIPAAFIAEDPIDELIAIGMNLNPWQPEPTLVDRARQLLNSETRTRIHQAKWDYDSLAGIMHLLMVIEMRELLRHLEDRLTAFEIKEQLCYRLVNYYYERSIYSRCSFYLSELPEEKLTFRLRLLRLRIAVNEKKLNLAIPLITELVKYSPSNPELMRLSGELHKYDGNYEEAEQFYLLARQTDPLTYAHLSSQ